MFRRSLQILVVEDDAEQQHLIAECLRADGHDVELASTGGSAVERATHRHPDVVLLEIGLPDVDGYELARHLRRELLPKTSVIIVLTGKEPPAIRQAVDDELFELHLSKPVEYPLLSGLIMFVHGRRSRPWP